MSGYLKDYRKGEKLKTYIDRVIRPPNGFENDMKEAVNYIIKLLNKIPKFEDKSIRDIVMSGSLGKGTTIQETTDADIVVFFNGFKDMESLVAAKEMILIHIEKHIINDCTSLWNWFKPWKPAWKDSIKVKQRTESYLELMIWVPYNGTDQPVKVNIFPAIDILSHHDWNIFSVYSEMQQKPPYIRKHYAVCFCKAQKELMGKIPDKLKDLIRLLKHWRNHNNVSMPSYCCEVLGFHLYLNKRHGFFVDMKTLFSEAIHLLQELKNITHTLTNVYTFNAIDSSNFPKDAFIMDPVNSFSEAFNIQHLENIASGTSKALVDVPADYPWPSWKVTTGAFGALVILGFMFF